MTKLSIYHNPRCSKSRQTLQLINDAGVDVDVIEYLKTPPTADTINNFLDLLSLQPRELMRTKEAEYKELNLANSQLSNDDLIAAIVNTPKLLERPIVVSNGKACIGRPPENVLALL